jgi:hypothetical protein
MNALNTKLASDPSPSALLKPSQIDNLGEAILTLTRELWVLTDRVHVLEAVIEQSGVSIRDAVDRFQPSPAFEQMLDAERAKLVDAVVGALSAGPQG